MTSRHAPAHGADSLESLHAAAIPVEPIDRRDSSCDMCGRFAQPDTLHIVTFRGSTSFWCPDCLARSRERMDAMLDAQERGIGGAA